MASFDPNKQFGPTPGEAGLLTERGCITLAAADDSGETFTIATKLARVKGGHAQLSDGTTAYPDVEVISSGQATFNRCGTINGTLPTVNYVLWGT